MNHRLAMLLVTLILKYYGLVELLGHHLLYRRGPGRLVTVRAKDADFFVISPQSRLPIGVRIVNRRFAHQLACRHEDAVDFDTLFHRLILQTVVDVRVTFSGFKIGNDVYSVSYGTSSTDCGPIDWTHYRQMPRFR